MISRREFMKMSGATVFCTCAGAMGLSACSTWRDENNVPYAPEGSYRWDGDRVIVSLTTANELGDIGAAVRLVLGQDEDSEERIIVVHSEEGIYKTFADHCTHNGKEVYYLHEERLFRCHSGRSHFDLEGNVIKGPAERALHLFPTRRVGDELVIEM